MSQPFEKSVAHARTASDCFYCSRVQWKLAVGVGTAVALIGWPFYSDLSGWVGVALFIVGATVVHLRYAVKYVIPFPHIGLLIAVRFNTSLPRGRRTAIRRVIQCTILVRAYPSIYRSALSSCSLAQWGGDWDYLG